MSCAEAPAASLGTGNLLWRIAQASAISPAPPCVTLFRDFATRLFLRRPRQRSMLRVNGWWICALSAEHEERWLVGRRAPVRQISLSDAPHARWRLPRPPPGRDPRSAMTDVLLTGAAGFIGFHVAQRLHGRRATACWALDNLNDHYDPTLKQARLDRLMPERRVHLRAAGRLRPGGDSRSCSGATALPGSCHLAAQAGRPLFAPEPARIRRRESRRLHECPRGLPAPRRWSTSSSRRPAPSTAPNTRLPFSVHDNVDHPLSLVRRDARRPTS